jgi:hypothetical protein
MTSPQTLGPEDFSGEFFKILKYHPYYKIFQKNTGEGNQYSLIYRFISCGFDVVKN